MSLNVIQRLCIFAISILALGGCGKQEQDEQARQAPSASPVLLVKQGTYRFSMYPEYVSENKSTLKLDIRDPNELFVKGAKASASLRAEDGHQQRVVFKEDDALQRYVAVVPLKHHEDYVIETRVSLLDGKQSLYEPRFVFHCGDRIPELDGVESVGTERSKQE